MDIGKPLREVIREPARPVPGIAPREPVPQPAPVPVEPERVPAKQQLLNQLMRAARDGS